jgi:DNA-binding NarL/FixJ family response regulator
LNRAKRVRVVVGEAAPSGAGILRSILEADGFEVVGQASSADQLQPVLAAADPQVIVFDADTTATTVLSARDWAPRAGIVVVWPASVLSPGADQQVEPSRASADLGEAVRRAVRIHRPQPVVAASVSDVMVFERIPEAEEPAVAAGAGGISSIGSRLRPRRSELSLALAAASIMFLVVAALALQPNKQPGLLAGQPAPTPTPSGPSNPGATGGQTGPSRSGGTGITGILAPLAQPAGATGSTPGVGPGPTQPGQPPPTTSPVTGRPTGGGGSGPGHGRASGTRCNNGRHGHHGLGHHGHHGLSCHHADQTDHAGGADHHGRSGEQGLHGGEGDDRQSDSHQGSNATLAHGHSGTGHGHHGHTGRARGHGNVVGHRT